MLVPGSATALLVLSVVVGIAVGVAASALIYLLETMSDWMGSLTASGRLVPLALVPLGLTAAWLITRRLAPEAAGDGVPETLTALGVDRGLIRGRVAPVKGVATALTVGLGGSAGREGPMVHIGGSLGSLAARWFGLGEDQVRSLVAAGAGAGIGASFNAPIAGMLFAIEILLRNFSIRHISSVVVCSVSAAVTTRSIVGEDLLLRAFPFRLEDPRELFLYAVLGLLAPAAGWALLKLTSWLEDLKLFRPSRWTTPVLAGALIGGVGVFEPRLLSSGQHLVAELVRFQPAVGAWWALGLLAAGKIFTSSVTFAGRGSGGAFMPSLFIGAALGAAFAHLVDGVWNLSVLQPGAFAVVGMAASFSALARAPLTAVIIVFEITGDYGLVLPLMLAASLATLLGDRLHKEGVYTYGLVKKGIHLARRPEVDVLDTITVGEVMSTDFTSVDSAMSTAELQGIFDHRRSHGVGVVKEGRLVGMVTVTDIIRAEGPSDSVLVEDVMSRRPVTVTAGSAVSSAMERMARLGVGRLPVVAEDDPERPVGMFRREDAVTAYQRALAAEVSGQRQTQRLRARMAPGADFFEYHVAEGKGMAGKKVREVSWPEGCTVVSIQRGAAVFVPTGDTGLEPGDALTIYGTTGGRRRLQERAEAEGGAPPDPSPGDR